MYRASDDIDGMTMAKEKKDPQHQRSWDGM